MTVYILFFSQKPLYSLAKFIQDRQKWLEHSRMRSHSGNRNATSTSLHHSSSQHSLSNGSGQAGDTKRRRKTPPNTPACSTGEL